MGYIKAIVSDFDGTLIGSKQKISDPVKSAILNWTAAGNIFSVATGRAYEGLLQNICHELGLSQYHIVRGGSEIISGETDEVVWGKYIPLEYVNSIIAKLVNNKQFVTLAESGKDLFTLDGKGDAEFATGAKIKTFADLPLEKVPKIAVPPLYSSELIIPLYEQLLGEYPTLHIVKTTSKKGMGIDINDGGAGKHQSLLEYSRLMGLDPANILGVGDSYNDHPLLSACGTKVAMGHAPKELKDIADFVVGTLEEDGIKQVIEYAMSNTSEG
jgi:Cof subfamily protein (haloacid dehalogenase superfamily)